MESGVDAQKVVMALTGYCMEMPGSKWTVKPFCNAQFPKYQSLKQPI